MSIKQMEIAFQFVNFSEARLKLLLRRGNWMRRHKDLKFVKTNKPEVEVGYIFDGRGPNKELEFYIYYNGRCVGNVTFDYAAGAAERRLVKMFPGKKLAVPHVGFDKSFRGLGHPQMIYGLALKKGTVLISDHHTASAAKLWDRVAQKYKAKLVYVNPFNGWKVSDTSTDEDDWKVMYL